MIASHAHTGPAHSPPGASRQAARLSARAPQREIAIDSPLGTLLAAATDTGISKLWFVNGPPGRPADTAPNPTDGPAGTHLAALQRQLADYFAGRRLSFSVPLDLHGTDFDRAVWDQLLAIPPGETRSYGQLATALGRPGGPRAVGRANGRNPVAIVVPCHRVIQTGGALGGYGGGLDRKRWLLDHERRSAGASLFPRPAPSPDHTAV